MSKPDKEILQQALSFLLDHFEGVVILVRDKNGGALVTAGGAGDDDGEDVTAYRELIQAAPGIMRDWQEAEATLHATPGGETLN